MATVDMPAAVTEACKKLRFRKPGNHATAVIVFKIEKSSLTLALDGPVHDPLQEWTDIHDILPDIEPRYVLVSHVRKHADGRTSYPLVLIFYNPADCPTASRVLYASANGALVTASGVTKVFELDDPNKLTTKWLDQQLQGHDGLAP